MALFGNEPTRRQHFGKPARRNAGSYLCVTGEDKVVRFDLIVAGEAGFHERLVARFAVLEVSETPTPRAATSPPRRRVRSAIPTVRW
jgi:hypothetical protein